MVSRLARGSVIACLSAITLAAGAGAQDGASTGWPAWVRAGSCDGLADVVAILTDVPQRDRDQMDPGRGATISTSVTDVALSLASLSQTPHSVVVQGPDSDTVAWCGGIPGSLGEGPGLAIALMDAEDQVAAVAWLRELGLDATTVHIFAIGDHAGGAGDEPAPDATPRPDGSPQPDPSPVPSPAAGSSPPPDDGDVPDEEIDPGEDIDVDVLD